MHVKTWTSPILTWTKPGQNIFQMAGNHAINDRYQWKRSFMLVICMDMGIAILDIFGNTRQCSSISRIWRFDGIVAPADTFTYIRIIPMESIECTVNVCVKFSLISESESESCVLQCFISFVRAMTFPFQTRDWTHDLSTLRRTP